MYGQKVNYVMALLLCRYICDTCIHCFRRHFGDEHV